MMEGVCEVCHEENPEGSAFMTALEGLIAQVMERCATLVQLNTKQ
jgi:C4-type Zn-finger protein